MLNFKSSLINLKKIATFVLAIKMLTNKNKKIQIIRSKKPNLMLKIKKGSPIGCKVLLEKRFVFLFFKKILFQNFFIQIKKFDYVNAFSINNTVRVKSLNQFYSLFNNSLTKLKINLIFSNNSKEEIYFWLKKSKLIRIEFGMLKTTKLVANVTQKGRV